MADSPSSRALREQHTSRAAQNTIAPPAHHAQSLECTPSSKRGMTGDAVDKENARVPMTANNGMQMQVSAIPARLQHRIHKPDGSGGSAHSNPPSSSSSSSSEEPTMAQLLAQSPAHLHTRHHQGPSSSSDGAGNNNNTGLASWRKGQGFKAWESELFKSQDVRRKADVAQLCEWGVLYSCCRVRLAVARCQWACTIDSHPTCCFLPRATTQFTTDPPLPDFLE